MEARDGFIVCPRCGSNMCYAQNVGQEETWLCLTCGFSSTTKMKEGSESEKQVTDRQPKVYKEIKFVDNNGYVWYPSVMTVPGKGMVYLDGTSVEDLRWASVPFRELTVKEKRLKQFKGQKYIVDTKKTQYFNRDNGFVEAALSVGLFGDLQ